MIIVVSGDKHHTTNTQDTLVVRTPLDMITRLERDRDAISTVVLMGDFASNRELTSFLAESYPALCILSGHTGEEPDPYLPAFA